MSELKVNSIKGVAASTAAITVNNTDGTCTANITNNLSNRNLIINGAMQVAQRGTSNTENGYGTVDRIRSLFGGTDEDVTQAQGDVARGTTPYTLGFRKAFKMTNGNQTSGVGTNDNIHIQIKLAAQDIANSGWNYTSTSSFVTFSFWCKSSVAQNFYGYLRSIDGTGQVYPFETGSLSADTWTKVTKTIPGNSNLQFDNDNGEGVQIVPVAPFFGTAFTDSSVSLNAWGAYSSSARMPDYTSTWYTTNDATFEITGIQLEVGSVATDFEHRSFGQELALCQRYYYQPIPTGLSSILPSILNMSQYNASTAYGHIPMPVEMRTNPSLDQATGTDYYRIFGNNSYTAVTSFSLNRAYKTGCELACTSTRGQASSCWVRVNADAAKLAFSAEL